MSSFFKRLFTRNTPPPVEYTEKTQEEILEEEIPRTLEKAELLELISTELSPEYLWETDAPLELAELG
jgi:hypothetical protein